MNLVEWARGLKSSYDRVFSGRGTQRDAEAVLANIAAACAPSEPSFVPGQPDTTAFNEGRRSVWLHINGMLHMTDQEVREMVQRYEAEEREALRKRYDNENPGEV